MRVLICGGTIVTPDTALKNRTLVITDGKITALEAGTITQQPGDQTIEADGLIVAPGMIDVHVHGGAGHDTMDATTEALHGMARFFASHGVTGYLPTTMTAPIDEINAAVNAVKNSPQPTDGAAHLGVHLEGPYLNPAHKGAQPDTHLRLPWRGDYLPWFDSGVAKLMTAAPELDGGLLLIEDGVHRGVEFAIGHSGAGIECVTAAADHGLRQATHTFNGMKGLHHRDPGTLGAVLTEDRIFAQIIVDGIHVHPAMVKLLVRAKGTARAILITDAMRAAGLPDGTYDLGDNRVMVKEGIARIASGNLAGSTLTMDAGLRNLMQYAGLTLQEALPMATSVPAAALNLTGQKGVLAPGADADIMLLDQNIEVTMTLVGGRIVYQRDA
jgi:N-acetylglucosamine-6-phosphate deacetylase